MNVAELFVNLGIKGSEKTLGALSSVKKGIGDLSATSLEAKAAIIGAVYALEKLMSHSAQQGTNLSNFNALTGISTKQLQQWNYAALQAGESNEEFTGSLKGVYDKMAQMKLNKGQPEGLDLVARTVGFDSKKAYKDTFYAMEQLQKFAHSKVPMDIQNQVLKNFGLSENTIAAMRKGVFNAQNFSKAPTYGEGEINKLNKVDVAWKNLGQKIQMAFGHFTSQHGMQLVGDLSKVTDQVFRMVDAFSKLADKLKLFQWVGKAFEGWSEIFGGVADSVDRVSKSKGGALEGMKKEGMSFLEGTKDFIKGLGMTLEESGAPKATGSVGESITPNIQGGSSKNVNNNTTINQNLNFQHDGKDHQKIKESHHKSVRDAYKQLSSLTQGS